MNECHFGLPQLWAVIHSRVGLKYKECALIKLIGLLLTTMASPNSFHLAIVEAEKGNIWHCLTKYALENKLLNQYCWSWYIIFLRRSYLIHWYQLFHPNIVESMPFRFLWANLYRRTIKKLHINDLPYATSHTFT